MSKEGALILVATPIGNLGDLAPRAVETLREVDVIAAEDTRRTRTLLSHAGVPAGRRLVSVHAHNERHTRMTPKGAAPVVTLHHVNRALADKSVDPFREHHSFHPSPKRL